MKKFTFDQIGYGGLQELTNDELVKVYADARDFNKLANSVREVTVVIKITPDNKRKVLKTTLAENLW